ncbi:sperm acrosome membrane-associated protein 1 [Falco biarmicus]|uniref:sperm acrosome membrane-associated protein 1 n=1 Tax=Falco biarmicus TaxID=345155 RepID=UPI0024BC992F|nr:sperm acrosome membrane-associated protein 1 [Falco biarmicus]
MALRAGGAAGRPALLLLMSLLLPSPAAGAVNGSRAEVAKPLGGLAEPGLDATVSAEVEYGACTVTCGIGIREVLLTRGCPGTEAKCLVRVEECRGPVDCGWGIPISEGLACVKMPCISIPPENRFTYVWKMLIPSKTPHILPNDSAIMEVCRGTHSVTFQCETQENGIIIASVKYTVYATTEIQAKKSRTIETEQSRRTRDAILVFCLVTGTIVTVGVIFAVIFMILHWGLIKYIWKSKFGQDNQEKLAHKRSLCNMD